MNDLCSALTRLLRYIEKNNSSSVSATASLAAFVTRLRQGDQIAGIRPTSESQIRRLLGLLAGYFDYLQRQDCSFAAINPSIAPNRNELLAGEAAYEFRKASAFLGHTWDTRALPSKSRYIRHGKTLRVTPREPPAFPEDRLQELLTKGFAQGTAAGLRDQLITLLCNGAGFRVSEPFHAFLGDVTEDPTQRGSALVRIRHPSLGQIVTRVGESSWKNWDRKTYLAHIGRQPRTQLLDGEAAGWKASVHDGKALDPFLQAHWFPADAGKVFWAIWQRYLFLLKAVDRDHPFAFISFHRASAGQPYRMQSFYEAHRRACERIGLTIRKDLGTTTHGHRHCYGRRLARANLDEIVIQRCMHHADISSQRVYTAPGLGDVGAALKDAEAKVLRSPFV